MSQSKGNLSLLSRGIAGVTYNKKIHTCNPTLNIFLEDEDYLNALQEFPTADKEISTSNTETKKIHKTYTTRKGPLMVFSDEFVNKHIKDEKLNSQDEQDNMLQTVEDLTRSILNFGSQNNNENDTICMHFSKTKHTPRLVRPGFSARRYISNWARYLDDEVVNKMLNNGTLKESSVFQNSTFLPNKKRRINDDLSTDPSPYRILRQMLLAPGPLNEFSFTWAKKTNLEDIDEEHELGAIQILNKNKEILTYGEMKKPIQANILSTLLVKSALNQVSQKKPVSEIDDTKDPLIKTSVLSKARVEDFDMINAIKVIVDTDTQSIQQSSLPSISESALLTFKDNKIQRGQDGFRGKALRKNGLQSIVTTPNRNFSNSWTPLFIQPLQTLQSSSTNLPHIKDGPLICLSHEDNAVARDGFSSSTDQVVTIEFNENGDLRNKRPENDVPFLLQPKRGRALFSNVDNLYKEGLPIQSEQNTPRAPGGQLLYHSRGKPKVSINKVVDIHSGDVDASLSLVTSHFNVKNEENNEDQSNYLTLNKEKQKERINNDINSLTSTKNEDNFLQILTKHADRIAISVIRGDGGVDLATDIANAANKWMNGDQNQSIYGTYSAQSFNSGVDFNIENTPLTSQSIGFQQLSARNNKNAKFGNELPRFNNSNNDDQRLQNIALDDASQQNLIQNRKSEVESQRLIQSSKSVNENENLEQNSKLENENQRLTQNSKSETERQKLTQSGKSVSNNESLKQNSKLENENERLTQNSKSETERQRLTQSGKSVNETESMKQNNKLKNENQSLTQNSKSETERQRLTQSGKPEIENESMKQNDKSENLQNSVSDKNLGLRNNSNIDRIIGQKEKTGDFIVGRIDDKYEFKDRVRNINDDKTLSKTKSKKSTPQIKTNKVNKKSNQKRSSIKETEKKSSSKKNPSQKPSSVASIQSTVEDADQTEVEKEVENDNYDLNQDSHSPRPQSFKLDDDDQNLSDNFNDVDLEDGLKYDAPSYEYWLAKRRENGKNANENGPTEEELEIMRLRRESVKDQREAKRRADAEKRRQDVIRKRQEVADAKRREAEALELRMTMEQELEEERRRRENEIRERKRLEREERERMEQEADEIEARKLRQIERERREKEEYRQRLEEMRQKQAEKERLRLEELARLAAEAELARIEEEARIALMQEDERVQYLARKEKEEQERLLAEEASRKIQEEEKRRLAEEARRIAEEQAFLRAVHEARMRFVNGLHAEHVGLERDINISPAFVWSYYDLLKWLGLELPEFEKAKVAFANKV